MKEVLKKVVFEKIRYSLFVILSLHSFKIKHEKINDNNRRNYG